jgi:hypothetical protein
MGVYGTTEVVPFHDGFKLTQYQFVRLRWGELRGPETARSVSGHRNLEPDACLHLRSSGKMPTDSPGATFCPARTIAWVAM